MAVTSGIGYSPLTDKVYLGKQNKEKGLWVGEKKDVTQEFIACSFAYFEENKVRIISTGKSSNMLLNVKKDKESIEKIIKYLKNELSKL